MKIILFGATGMLGKYIFNELKKIYVVKCILRNNFDIINDNWLKLENILKDTIDEGDIIINCSGIIPQKKNNNNLKEYIKVNSLFPHKLNEIISKKNCHFIHITTDCVFGGLKGNYIDSDNHDSDSIYGISKSLGECENATIIRTSIIGEELYSKKSLLEWVISNKNNTIDGYTNHYWNGVTCLTLAKIICEMIEKNIFWKGVRHIFSPETVSKYYLCQYINEIYNLNIKINPIEKNFKNLSLNGEELFKIDNIYNQIVEQKNYNIKFGEFDILKACRFCKNSDIQDIIKFNDFPLSGCFLKNKDNIIYERNYPLTFLYCDNCKTGLVKEIITEKYLFTNINESSYFYYSSTISSLVDHFKNLYNLIISTYGDKKKILEIGCNDGVFLNNFINKDYKLIGIDPSQTINIIDSPDILKYNTFFNDEVVYDIFQKYGKQDIVVACNCLAHIHDMENIYKNIKRILDKDGILIIEVHYLKNIIERCNFDFIYHEHMSYYSITTIIQICINNDLYLEDIEFIETHGGSMRAFITHKNENKNYYNSEINNYLQYEESFKQNIINLFINLDIWKKKIIEEINSVKKTSLLVGYGASGRTNMIINYLSVNFDIILDDSINKINSFMPYYHTEIQNSDDMYTINNIKVIFILAWPYTNSIIKKHVKFIKNGGVFIKILPTIEKIDINNWMNYI
jgi:dTDP-4-dehydrorhamnose reductase